MTAYGSAENAVEALKAGAFDYLTKPVDLKQFRSVVASAIQEGPAPARGAPARPAPRARRARTRHRGECRLAAAGRPLAGDATGQGTHRQGRAQHGAGAGARRVRHRQGTGRARHPRLQPPRRGPVRRRQLRRHPGGPARGRVFRRAQGLVHRRTAGPRRLFQAARGGTLFLDEIGDLPLAMQSKLLRAIQERSVRPLGSTQEDAVDVRVVSATHKDLAADVQAGRFRQDLYYRLNVIEILVPPLRERRDDLPALCEALLARIAQESGMPVPVLSRALLEQLAAHPLAGNVRELENLLHRAVAISDGEELQVDFAPTPAAASAARGRGGCPGRCPTPPPAAERAPAERPAGLPGPAGARDPGPRPARERLQPHRRGARLGLSLRQIRYRIARLNIAAPQVTRPMMTRRRPEARALPVARRLVPLRAAPALAELRAAAGGRARRPDRLHSISLPPGVYGGDEVQACSPTPGLGRPSLFPAASRPAGLGALLHPARRRAVAVRQLRRARLACRRLALRGRDNCNDDSVGIELEGLEGGPSSRRSTRPWPPCARRWPSATRSSIWPATGISHRAASRTRARVSTGPCCSGSSAGTAPRSHPCGIALQGATIPERLHRPGPQIVAGHPEAQPSTTLPPARPRRRTCVKLCGAQACGQPACHTHSTRSDAQGTHRVQACARVTHCLTTASSVCKHPVHYI